ncbi:MAG TPA: hypothetical protein VI382_08055, partial [Candidatus Manganitrophaceae bacterium]|nr:hypothetical protein [Candidatus Manganitrophaceae bacterium]
MVRQKIQFLLAVMTGVVFAGWIQSASAVTIVNGTFVDPVGLTYGTLIGGSDGGGQTLDPTTFGYVYTGMVAGYGDARDWNWVHDTSAGGAGNNPSTGLIYDLGGQANQVVVFPIIDHDPLPGEAYEYNVYLSNDLTNWTQATLVTLYDEGWSADPNIADGWTTVWQLSGGATAQYASITWCNPGNPDPSYVYCDGDAEIDAVAGLTQSGKPVPEPA